MHLSFFTLAFACVYQEFENKNSLKIKRINRTILNQTKTIKITMKELYRSWYTTTLILSINNAPI